MKYSTSTLGVLALSALCGAAFVACSSPDPTTATGASTGAGGDSTGATTGSTSASTGAGGDSTGATTGSTSASAGTGSGLSAEAQVNKLCDAVIAPFCEALFSCCADPATLASAGKTIEGCKTKRAMECNASSASALVAQVQAGNTVLDEARLAACVSSLVSMKSGGAACTRPPWFVLQFDCIAAFQGTLAPGAFCNPSGLTDEGFILCKDGACDTGKCRGFVATGAACDPSQGSLGGCNYVEGELCLGTGTVGKCGPQGKVGDACGDPGKNNTDSCESRSCGPAGTCIAPTAAGICWHG